MILGSLDSSKRVLGEPVASMVLVSVPESNILTVHRFECIQ